MICCKIVTDYDSSKGSFSELYKNLSEHGGLLWADNTLYFGSDENSFNKKKIESILKKAGYDSSFIKEYKSISDIKEIEVISGWLFEWVIKINTKKVEETHQKELKKLSKRLDELEAELDEQDLQRQKEDTQTKEE